MKKKILIVDDAAENIDVLMEHLKSDYILSAARSGEKALKILEKNQPDLILLDIMMPGMNGYEVCQQIKANEKLKDIPIIFITAMSEVGDEAKGLEVGAIDYIVKPISPPIVKARVKNHLQLSQTLKEVQITSAKIRNLMDNAGQGFLSFKLDMIVDNDYSQECLHIFDADIKGAWFPKLIDGNDPEQQNFIAKTIIEIFSSEDLKREVLLSLLPAECLIKQKCIQIQYKIIQDVVSHENHKMMVVLTDISDKRRLENQMEQERKILRMVAKALTEFNDLLRLINKFKTFCGIELFEILEHNKPIDDRVFEIFRKVHTFKGLFSQFEMASIVNRLHDLETAISKLRQESHPDVIGQLKGVLTQTNLIESIENDISTLISFFGQDAFNYKRVVKVDESKLKEIEEELRNYLCPEQNTALLSKIQRLRYESVKTMLKKYLDYIDQLAERNEKKICQFDIEGEDVLVDPDFLGDFIDSLIHVFRNCIDHGIETEEERVEYDKDEIGHITCRTDCIEDELTIFISDDGRGIDVNKLRERAVQLSIYSKDTVKTIPDNEIIDLIFIEELSSRSSVTEISGRGIGLSAVKHSLQKINGTVSIETAINKGTSFYFRVPLKQADQLITVPLNEIFNSVHKQAVNYLKNNLHIIADTKDIIVGTMEDEKNDRRINCR
ncbi:MAG: response regulator [Desulfobacterales bacterium]|nr:response regulator [Desulfobacterales bacterium]